MSNEGVYYNFCAFNIIYSINPFLDTDIILTNDLQSIFSIYDG